MKKSIKKIVTIALLASMLTSTGLSVLAQPIIILENREVRYDEVRSNFAFNQDNLETLCNLIIKIKNSNPNLSVEEFESQLIKMKNSRFIVDKVEGAYNIWKSLTSAEQKLTVIFPSEAIMVNTARNNAWDLTEKKFGRDKMIDSSRVNSVLHATWNVLIKKYLSNENLAKSFTDAHEQYEVNSSGDLTRNDGVRVATDSDYMKYKVYKISPNGVFIETKFNGLDARKMDLHNNSQGLSISMLRSDTDMDLFNKVLNLLNNNKLKYLFNDSEVLGCKGTVIKK